MKRPVVALLASALATAVVLSGSLALTAAAQDASSDATIQIGSLYEPQNLDNTAGGGQGVTEAFDGNVYEGLFHLTDSGEVEPLLADSYTVSDDGLTYTFTLKPGVTFHSGKPLTSEDVKFSIERVFAEESQSARKSSFGAIESIEAPDPGHRGRDARGAVDLVHLQPRLRLDRQQGRHGPHDHRGRHRSLRAGRLDARQLPVAEALG